ncbi:MipA/OmpV family protein [Psychrobacter ciconiae]|uniref:MipA/OmpV family protein n=1 Tax=Psychrobacter ciconiae TaxID=1553449 RepID=UPI001D0F7741|nr:MipA/OmpV family protein [Psychrobacter ciconiae]
MMTIFNPLSFKIKSPKKAQLFVLSTAVFAMSAQAFEFDNIPVDKNAQLSVGANVLINKSAYDTDGTEVRVLPGVFYDNNKIYARGAQAGVYLINDGSNQLSAYTELAGSEFDPDDAGGALSKLDKRKWSAAAGLTYLRLTPIGGFRAQLATDVLGRNDGSLGRLTYLAKVSKDKLTVYPSAGFEWHDRNYNEYYYGVSNEESARSGVAAYQPSQSFSPYVSVSANYDINDKWAGFASQSLHYLPNDLYDSPMVDSRIEANTAIGLLYKF